MCWGGEGGGEGVFACMDLSLSIGLCKRKERVEIEASLL